MKFHQNTYRNSYVKLKILKKSRKPYENQGQNDGNSWKWSKWHTFYHKKCVKSMKMNGIHGNHRMFNVKKPLWSHDNALSCDQMHFPRPREPVHLHMPKTDPCVWTGRCLCPLIQDCRGPGNLPKTIEKRDSLAGSRKRTCLWSPQCLRPRKPLQRRGITDASGTGSHWGCWKTGGRPGKHGNQ